MWPALMQSLEEDLNTVMFHDLQTSKVKGLYCHEPFSTNPQSQPQPVALKTHTQTLSSITKRYLQKNGSRASIFHNYLMTDRQIWQRERNPATTPALKEASVFQDVSVAVPRVSTGFTVSSQQWSFSLNKNIYITVKNLVFLPAFFLAVLEYGPIRDQRFTPFCFSLRLMEFDVMFLFVFVLKRCT